MCSLFSLSPCPIKEQPYSEAILLSVSAMKSSQNSSSLIITHRLLKSRGDLPILLQRNTMGKTTLGLSRMIPKKPSGSNWTSKKTCFGRSLRSTSVTLNKPCYAVSPPEEWCSRIQASPVQLYWIKLSQTSQKRQTRWRREPRNPNPDTDYHIKHILASFL